MQLCLEEQASRSDPSPGAREQSIQLLERAPLHSQNKDVFSRVNGFTLSAPSPGFPQMQPLLRLSAGREHVALGRSEGASCRPGTARPPGSWALSRPLWLWGKEPTAAVGPVRWEAACLDQALRVLTSCDISREVM